MKFSISSLEKEKLRILKYETLDYLIIGLVLAAMTVANYDWLFTRGGIDGWMYFGYFKHFDHSSFLSDNKKIARLPWILLGYFIHKLFSNDIANYILRLGLVYLGACTFYKISSILFNRATAVLGTLAFMTYMPGLGSGGWDYHNTLAGPLYLISYLLIIQSSSSKDHLFARFFLFGILFTLTVHTNILFFLLIPALFFEVIHQRQTHQIYQKFFDRWMWASISGILIGGIFITVILGIINAINGRSFFFFRQLFHRSAELLSNPSLEKSWWSAWNTFWWLKGSQTPYIESILIVLLTVFLLDLKKRKWGLSLTWTSSGTVYLGFLTSVGIFILFQELGHPMLQPYYMAFPLVIPTFFSLSALIYRATSYCNTSLRWSILHSLLSSVLFLAIFLPLALGKIQLPQSLFYWLPEVWRNGKPMVILMISLYGAILLTYIKQKNFLIHNLNIRYFVVFLLLIGFSTANAEWPPSQTPSLEWYELGVFFRDQCHYGKDVSKVVNTVDKFLFPYFERGKKVNITYDGNEKIEWAPKCTFFVHTIGNALVGTGYDNVMPWVDMQSTSIIPDKYLDNISVGQDVLAVLTNNLYFSGRLLDYLRKKDAHWSILDKKIIHTPRFKLNLIIIGVQYSKKEKLQINTSIHSIIKGNNLIRNKIGETIIDFPKNSWQYTANLIPMLKKNVYSGTIIIKLKIKSGRVAVGALNKSGNQFLKRYILGPFSNPIEIYFSEKSWNLTGPIIFESTDNRGARIKIISTQFVPASH